MSNNDDKIIEDAIEALVEIPESEEPCTDCGGPLECTYCNEDAEWPVGQTCSICNGTKVR